MMEKSVLIACPTRGLNQDPQQWLASLIVILNDVRKSGFTHATYFPYQMNWWDANNEIWNIALRHKFTHILRIDDDVWNVPMDGFSKLYAADKDVIGAAYPNRRFPYTVCALNRTTEDSLVDTSSQGNLTLKAVQNYGYAGEDILPCDLVGFGMTLIKVAPFKYLERPMYKGQETCPDDTYFAQVCLDNNIKQFVHFGVRLHHRHVTFANNGHLYNADVLAYTEKKNAAKTEQQAVASSI